MGDWGGVGVGHGGGWAGVAGEAVFGCQVTECRLLTEAADVLGGGGAGEGAQLTVGCASVIEGSLEG